MRDKESSFELIDISMFRLVDVALYLFGLQKKQIESGDAIYRASRLRSFEERRNAYTDLVERQLIK